MEQRDLINAHEGGMRRVRDGILAIIKELKAKSDNEETYNAYQKVVSEIEYKYGEFLSPEPHGLRSCSKCVNPCEMKKDGCGCRPIRK
jgi:hypothetical protein